MSRAVLADTHIWLWFALGIKKKLSGDAIAMIEKASNNGRLYVSVMSIWEVSLLAAKGRIHLGQSTTDWIAGALRLPGLQLSPLEVDVAVESNQLPGEFHPDPVDRMLVATARCRSFTILTQDQKILQYAKQGYVTAIDP